MAISFNSNIAALKASRIQSVNDAALSRTFERLSTGLRINRAADDSAGLAVASGLGTESRVLNRALRNVNDGISALQIADATYSAAGTLLTRMGELATQSAAGIFSRTQRIALNSEYKQLDAELRRISKQTNFNGIELTQGATSARASTLILSTNPDEILGVSADGRYVLFRANSLLSRYDTVTGQTNNVTNQASAITSAKMSSAGNIVVFEAQLNPTGQNPSNYSQIFQYDFTSSSTTQLTSNSSVLITYGVSAVSADGTAAAYYAEDMFSGTFTYSLYNNETNLTKIMLGPTAPMADASTTVALSSDGSYAAILSSLDSGVGLPILYRYDSASQSLSTIYAQEDFGFNGIDLPELAVNSQGRIFFSSSDNIGGANPNSSDNIWSVSGPVVSASDISIVGYSSASGTLSKLSLTPDESGLVFLSSAVYGTNNTGRVQAFRYDIVENSFTQQTAYTDNSISSLSGFLSADGNTIVYRSSGMRSFDVSRQAASLNIEAGVGRAGSITASIGALNGTLKGLGATTIGSRTAAIGAIDRINRNIELLSLARGTLGAGLSRLETAQSLVGKREQEILAAYGRIVDSDVASDSAELLRRNILQNTTAALFAQAKLIPQIGLDLLKDAAVFAPRA
jgi:flagellin